MNTSQIKLLIWTAAGVFGAGLAANVAWFVTRLPEVRASVPETRLRAVLEDVGEVVQKSDVVLPYGDVEASIINLNWTGKPAPKVVVTETAPTQ
ncbi:MAG TPA: hypothetical protein VMT18_05935, partial [Planctomycetota bacterium]|nr:hypothetical protein [Planctomycetota bacterium]